MHISREAFRSLLELRVHLTRTYYSNSCEHQKPANFAARSMTITIFPLVAQPIKMQDLHQSTSWVIVICVISINLPQSIVKQLCKHICPRMLMTVFYLQFIPVIVHSLLFEAYKLVYLFLLFFFLPTQLSSTSLRYTRVVHVLLIVNY